MRRAGTRSAHLVPQRQIGAAALRRDYRKGFAHLPGNVCGTATLATGNEKVPSLDDQCRAHDVMDSAAGQRLQSPDFSLH
jgi:hypothetical protein